MKYGRISYPQSNGIYERIHRIKQDEFYAVAFRNKLYQDLETLRRDQYDWIKLDYNN
jgi:transposase InsO family protein